VGLSWCHVSRHRFGSPYTNGQMVRHAKRETIAELSKGGHLRGGGHWTRDLAFSNDGKKLYVSVGSRSNDDDPDTHPEEFQRADVLEMNPDGSGRKIFVSGVRNAVGIAVHPRSGELWGSTNERDGLGDNVPPDYITNFTPGGFYGWPYSYTGVKVDPRHRGVHPELVAKALKPDVLIQAHNASLELCFYTGKQFPAKYHGDIFASEHGSWNRSVRTGYEVIRIPLEGKTRSQEGEYEDFLTGFVTDSGEVWGRPVGITVAHDGALLVSDDLSKSIWRVSWVGK
jgi:glucose/arabinose dehydrogenase